jgi:hypothetical protein
MAEDGIMAIRIGHQKVFKEPLIHRHSERSPASPPFSPTSTIDFFTFPPNFEAVLPLNFPSVAPQFPLFGAQRADFPRQLISFFLARQRLGV